MILLPLCVFLLIGSLKATNIDSLVLNANNLFEHENFSLAAIEYERAIYNLEIDKQELINQLLFKKSFCYKMIGRYDDGLISLNRIRVEKSIELFKDSLIYEKALNYFLKKDYINAESLLIQLHNKGINNSTYLLILVLNEEEKWEEAQAIFSDYIQYHKLPVSYNDNYYFLEDKNFQRKSKPAKLLSHIIPGLGQLYLKKPIDALMSSSFNFAAGYFVVSSIIQGYVVAGLITGLPFFIRFYFGGIKNVNKIIEEKNMIQKKEINENLEKEILKIELLK